MPTTADKIGQRLRAAFAALSESVSQYQSYGVQLEQGSRDLAEVQRNIAVVVEGLRQVEQLQEEEIDKLGQLATLSFNFIQVFARSDSVQIRQFLEIADPGPRAVALRALSEAKIEEWRVAIETIYREREAS